MLKFTGPMLIVFSIFEDSRRFQIWIPVISNNRIKSLSISYPIKNSIFYRIPFNCYRRTTGTLWGSQSTRRSFCKWKTFTKRCSNGNCKLTPKRNKSMWYFKAAASFSWLCLQGKNLHTWNLYEIFCDSQKNSFPQP